MSNRDDERYLPILECRANEVLKLDKGAAMFLVNGELIQSHQLRITVTRFVVDEDGKPVIDEDGVHIKEESLVTPGSLLTGIKIERRG